MYDSQKGSFVQRVDVRGGLFPTSDHLVCDSLSSARRTKYTGRPSEETISIVAENYRDGAHVPISHALVMTVTSRKRRPVVDMRNHNPKEEVMDPVMKQYEAPQLIDLEDEVGCDALCATGGDSAPIVQAPS
jgi:hypothetical protein